MSEGTPKYENTKGWAVMFSPAIIERMSAFDNKKLFSPYCVFKTRKEAIEWIDEKWVQGFQGAKGTITVRRCEIVVSNSSF